ncbi:MAG: hypothetical protein AAGU76_18775 [Sedimentibacter sp.]|uniref:hypothetical protein n=1 Tax=Sedimentibacter sp. TaxID=1960295 RepID=UPI003157F380
MGMSQEEFKNTLLKDYAELKKQRDKEYMDYVSIARYRRNQHRKKYFKFCNEMSGSAASR